MQSLLQGCEGSENPAGRLPDHGGRLFPSAQQKSTNTSHINSDTLLTALCWMELAPVLAQARRGPGLNSTDFPVHLLPRRQEPSSPKRPPPPKAMPARNPRGRGKERSFRKNRNGKRNQTLLRGAVIARYMSLPSASHVK